MQQPLAAVLAMIRYLAVMWQLASAMALILRSVWDEAKHSNPTCEVGLNVA